MADLTPEAIAELRKMHGEAVLCRAQFEGKITARMAGVFVDRLPALLDAALWAVNLQADMKAGIDAIDRGEFTTVDKMREELTAEVLDAAERCAAMDAYLDSTGIGLRGVDGIEALDDLLQRHRQDSIQSAERCAAAEAQAKAAGELLRAAKEARDWLIECDEPGDAADLGEAIEAAERAGVKP